MALVLLAVLLVFGSLGFSLAKHVGFSWAKLRRSRDLLASILAKTAPVAAADELAASNSTTCVSQLNGSTLLITKDPKIADYIFNGRSKANYVRRPATVEGLKCLGMYNKGLIWCNNIPSWAKVRGCFQEALNHDSIEKAANHINSEAKGLLVEGEVDLMSICRRLTFRATLHTFFGIDAHDFSSKSVDEAQFIEAIICYFKAWEYFLMRPQEFWDDQLTKHSGSVANLQAHVNKMLASINFDDEKSNLFIHKLHSACQEIKSEEHSQEELLMQGALEMMLAGTDTSSVTAYYALLGLAGDTELQMNLREDLQATKDVSKAKLLRCVVDEALRFKPVGPVVLREAVKDDPHFPKGILMESGTAILIHLAEMNLSEKLWPDPQSFCPMRFFGKDTSSTNKKFFPFGHGPKGCIGMHLGRREVNTILEAVVMNYHMSVCGEGSLGSLETHWDIANQPDKPTLIKLVKVRKD